MSAKDVSADLYLSSCVCAKGRLLTAVIRSSTTTSTINLPLSDARDTDDDVEAEEEGTITVEDPKAAMVSSSMVNSSTASSSSMAVDTRSRAGMGSNREAGTTHQHRRYVLPLHLYLLRGFWQSQGKVADGACAAIVPTARS